jgi:hypothetical protein
MSMSNSPTLIKLTITRIRAGQPPLSACLSVFCLVKCTRYACMHIQGALLKPNKTAFVFALYIHHLRPHIAPNKKNQS